MYPMHNLSDSWLLVCQGVVGHPLIPGLIHTVKHTQRFIEQKTHKEGQRLQDLIQL